MAKRTELPDVLKDADLNRFISSVLESAKSDEQGVYAQIANVQIDRTVEQLRAFFPEQYEGGDMHSGDNVTAWPDRVGA